MRRRPHNLLLAMLVPGTLISIRTAQSQTTTCPNGPASCTMKMDPCRFGCSAPGKPSRSSRGSSAGGMVTTTVMAGPADAVCQQYGVDHSSDPDLRRQISAEGYVNVGSLKCIYKDGKLNSGASGQYTISGQRLYSVTDLFDAARQTIGPLSFLNPNGESAQSVEVASPYLNEVVTTDERTWPERSVDAAQDYIGARSEIFSNAVNTANALQGAYIVGATIGDPDLPLETRLAVSSAAFGDTTLPIIGAGLGELAGAETGPYLAVAGGQAGSYAARQYDTNVLSPTSQGVYAAKKSQFSILHGGK